MILIILTHILCFLLGCELVDKTVENKLRKILMDSKGDSK